MSDEEKVFVISYDVGDPRQTLIVPGAAIRSGGSKVFAHLPAPESILKAIPGVKISKTLKETAQDFNPPHPKASYYVAMKAALKK
jgi:hypothetical protein